MQTILTSNAPSLTNQMIVKAIDWNRIGNPISRWVISRGIASLGVAGASLRDAIQEAGLTAYDTLKAVYLSCPSNRPTQFRWLRLPSFPSKTSGSKQALDMAWEHFGNTFIHIAIAVTALVLGMIAPSKLFLPAIKRIGFADHAQLQSNLLSRIMAAARVHGPKIAIGLIAGALAKMGYRYYAAAAATPENGEKLLKASIGIAAALIGGSFALYQCYSQCQKNRLTEEPILKRPIDLFDETKLKTLVDAYRSKALSSDRFIRHRGKQMPVFELVDFPGLIFKLPSEEEAQEMLGNIERCQALVKQHALNHCIIPSAKIIPTDEKFDDVIFVMEKIEGLCHEVALEAAEVAYESFQKDSNTQAKWKNFFQQAAEFIALSGYWDTSWDNILIMENGFGFVDFDHVKITNCGRNQAQGLSCLSFLAPPEFIDIIDKIAEKYDIKRNIQSFADFEVRKRDLELHSGVRKWHREHGITQAKKIDTGTVLYQGLTPAEKFIIDKFNKKIECNVNLCNSLIWLRLLHWQPMFTEESYETDRPKTEQSLRNLIEKGLVFEWTTEENPHYPCLVEYKIYL